MVKRDLGQHLFEILHLSSYHLWWGRMSHMTWQGSPLAKLTKVYESVDATKTWLLVSTPLQNITNMLVIGDHDPISMVWNEKYVKPLITNSRALETKKIWSKWRSALVSQPQPQPPTTVHLVGNLKKHGQLGWSCFPRGTEDTSCLKLPNSANPLFRQILFQWQQHFWYFLSLALFLWCSGTFSNLNKPPYCDFLGGYTASSPSPYIILVKQHSKSRWLSARCIDSGSLIIGGIWYIHRRNIYFFASQNI